MKSGCVVGFTDRDHHHPATPLRKRKLLGLRWLRAAASPDHSAKLRASVMVKSPSGPSGEWASAGEGGRVVGGRLVAGGSWLAAETAATRPSSAAVRGRAWRRDSSRRRSQRRKTTGEDAGGTCHTLLATDEPWELSLHA